MDYSRKEAKAYAQKHMKGLWSASPYPFRQDQELDEKGLVSDLNHCIDTIGVDARLGVAAASSRKQPQAQHIARNRSN